MRLRVTRTRVPTLTGKLAAGPPVDRRRRRTRRHPHAPNATSLAFGGPKMSEPVAGETIGRQYAGGGRIGGRMAARSAHAYG